jgi:mitotic spindle assembly checkpoint protein MAD1
MFTPRRLQASYTAEASQAAPETRAESLKAYEAQTIRINQLEALLSQYKSANQALSEEVDALGGGETSVSADDPDTMVKKTAWNREKREALLKEVERARKDKAELQESQ